MKEFEEVGIIVNDNDEIVGWMIRKYAEGFDGNFRVVEDEEFRELVASGKVVYLETIDDELMYNPNDEELQVAKERGFKNFEKISTEDFIRNEVKFRENTFCLMSQGAAIGKLMTVMNSPVWGQVAVVAFYGNSDLIDYLREQLEESTIAKVLAGEQEGCNSLVATIPTDEIKMMDLSEVVFDTLPVNDDEVEDLADGLSAVMYKMCHEKRNAIEKLRNWLAEHSREHASKYRGGLTLSDMKSFKEEF